MFDPKDFARWLGGKYPQYMALPDSDIEFIKAVSEGDLINMAAYNANRQFFMKQIVEYTQDRALYGKFLILGIVAGISLLLSGIFLLSLTILYGMR